MKTLIIIIILLFPYYCSAQEGNVFLIDTAKYKGKPMPLYTTSNNWHFAKPLGKGITKVVNNENGKYETLAIIDTFGHLKVYGDTLSVLKAIFKQYGIEIKPNNQ